MKPEFKIEKNVPIPETIKSKGRPFIYPLGKLRVGESLFISNGWLDKTYRNRTDFRPAVSQYGIRNKKKFLTRKIEGGYRVWRVE